MIQGRVRGAVLAGLLLAPLFAFARPTPAAAADGPWIDTHDRAEVIAAHRAEFDRTEPASGYDGDAAACRTGTTSQAFRDSVVQRVNWYRRMAGLAPVTERAGYTTAAQQSATMMSAEGTLSHTPGPDHECHSDRGATAAAKSNLALGINGIDAVDAYMRDPGGNNTEVGHRRALLYPQLREIGTGDVETSDANGTWAANSLHVFDDNLWGERPAVREPRGFVAWPPSGYVPPEAVWGRWSFSLSEADFSSATVSVVGEDGPVTVSVLDRIQAEEPGSRIAPEAAIVWSVRGDTDSTALPAPTDGDECYTVTIAGVKVQGTVRPDYRYTTCVIDVDAPADATTAGPTADGACPVLEFSTWSTPCWHEGGTLGGFVDVTADWQREPVAWLVGNAITTGVSPHRFDPDSSVSRAQAATLIWRMAGSPAPSPVAPHFVDVPAGSYYEDAVRWMAGHGITTGTGSGRFSPDAPATRAEFVTLLWRLVDQPSSDASIPFADLTASWQTSAIRWASATDITTGTGPTTFAPDTTVTRGQAAALLSRFADALA